MPLDDQKERNKALEIALVRRGDGWHLLDILYADTDLRIIHETMKPTIQVIEDRRAARKPNFLAGTDFVRVLLLMEEKPEKAIEVADHALKVNPSDRGIRYLKALALLFAEKRNDAVKLLIEINKEHPDFAPVIKKLAELYTDSEDETEKKQVVDFYQRYLSLEPYDPRAHLALAKVYENAEDNVQAEVSYRKALEVNPTHADLYRELAEFLVHQNRFREAAALLDTGDKYKAEDEDLFGYVIYNLYFMDDYDCLESFTANQPARMKKSMLGNYYLGQVSFEKGRYLRALRVLKLAARLDLKSTATLLSIADVYRKLSRWKDALDVADQAIVLEPQSAGAHYRRACALARLGQKNAAMAALTRSVELDPDIAADIAEEVDLKSLAALPAFKKLVAEAEVPKPNPVNP